MKLSDEYKYVKIITISFACGSAGRGTSLYKASAKGHGFESQFVVSLKSVRGDALV
jgi:hypothetical protein